MKRIIAVVLFLTLLPLYGYAQSTDDQYKEGLAAYNSKDWDSAVSIMNQVVQADPSNWQAYQILGYSYFKQKNLENSLQNSQESLKLNPDNPTLQKFVDRLKVKLSVTSDEADETEVKSTPTTPSTGEEAVPTSTPSSIPTQAEAPVETPTPTEVPTQTNTPVVKSKIHKKHVSNYEENNGGKLFIQIDGGLDFNSYNTGFDGECFVGYSFSRSFALGVLSGFHSYGWAYDYSEGYVPLVLEGNLSIGSVVRPYLIFGGGTAFHAGGFYGSGTSDLLGELGLGFSFEISNSCDFFIQGKITEINTSSSYGSYNYSYTAYYHPIQTGFNFSL